MSEYCYYFVFCVNLSELLICCNVCVPVFKMNNLIELILCVIIRKIATALFRIFSSFTYMRTRDTRGNRWTCG